LKKFGGFIAKQRVFIIIIAILLLVPSIYGMAVTKINYDLLTYLPKNLDSMKGQEILDKKFSNAATSMLVIEKMDSQDVMKIKDTISKLDGIDEVIWISDLLDTSIPKEILPDDIQSIFYRKYSTLLFVKFTDSAASETTQKAISDMRKITNKQCFISGMSAIVKDTQDLADKETPYYVLIAVVLIAIVLCLTMESLFIPLIFILAIGFAIVYNLGSNIFLGSISYVTKSIAAILQLGVTMDFAIFLLHRYEKERKTHGTKEEAMAEAISKTTVAIGGSCLTTTAGFLALCTMNLGLGMDIGIVMAKGVILGFISTITILPALILFFDKPINRYSHKTILPSFNKTSTFVTKHYKGLIVVFILALIPAFIGKQNTEVYYNLDRSLPQNLDSIIATNKLKTDYNMTTSHFIIVNKDIEPYKLSEMVDKIDNVAGINMAIGEDKLIGPGVPEDFIPEKIRETFTQDKYKLILANSIYKAATDEENTQITEVTEIVKEYDKDGMVTGEGALTKDLTQIAGKDFVNVAVTSIVVILLILALVFGSLTIPVVLVFSIELAIFINMGIPFYMGSVIPFVASIVIGCIQLGSTVNYAILVTTRFREELNNGYDKFEAMRITIQGTAKSVIASALSFFAATAGVVVISKLSIIATLCTMIARGALISMIVIIFILPAILIATEGIISKTTLHWTKTFKKNINLAEERL
jgi:predicted RND superfamily exporter protein